MTNELFHTMDAPTLLNTVPERILLRVRDGKFCSDFRLGALHPGSNFKVEYVRADVAAEKCNALTDAALARDEIFTLLREDRDSWRRVAERLQNDGNALQQDYEREVFRETPTAQPVQPDLEGAKENWFRVRLPPPRSEDALSRPRKKTGFEFDDGWNSAIAEVERLNPPTRQPVQSAAGLSSSRQEPAGLTQPVQPKEQS